VERTSEVSLQTSTEKGREMVELIWE